MAGLVLSPAQREFVDAVGGVVRSLSPDARAVALRKFVAHRPAPSFWPEPVHQIRSGDPAVRLAAERFIAKRLSEDLPIPAGRVDPAQVDAVRVWADSGRPEMREAARRRLVELGVYR